MKKIQIKKYLSNNKETLSTKSSRLGGYSLLLVLIVFCIVVGVNVMVTKLPSKWTQFDISSARLYSLTSSSKVVLSNLEEDVTVYWICQSGKEDTVVEKLLDVYDSMSNHVTVEKKDPDTYPKFAEQYTDETVTNNSLVVVKGDKSRYIPYDNLYETSGYSYTGTTTATAFDGEGQITAAIHYVVSDSLPVVYTVSGHGEGELSESTQNSIQRNNMETQEISLLNVDEIPEDAVALLINAPTSDYSQEELDMLSDYVDAGGHLIVLSGPQEEEELDRLNGFLESYGVTAQDGIVIDQDRDHYAFNYPYILLPTMNSSEITDSIIEDNSYVILPIAKGLEIGTAKDGYTISSLLDTSDEAYSKKDGYDMDTYEQEEGDLSGPFSLAVSITSDSGDGKIVWIASNVLLDETYDSYSSGANTDLLMNTMSWMSGETETISIRSKSLSYNYLTISAAAATTIKVILIGIIPAIFFFYGLEEVLRRRKQV